MGCHMARFVATCLSTSAPEMHSIRLRTYGQACAMMFSEIFSFAAAFYTPYILSPQYGNMGLNVGYFYFGKFILIIGSIQFLLSQILW
jgi:SP family sugar:H+ symporter-like MFS transporter